METQIKIGNHRVMVRHPDGTKLRVEGKTLIADPQRPEDVRFRKELEASGLQWGDAVKWMADKLGIEQCPSCRETQIVLNNVRQLGWAEAIRQIRQIKGL